MYNWMEQGLFVVQWLFVISVLHISLWSVMKRWIPEYAYPVSYPSSLILYGITTWWLGMVHLPVWTAVLPFLILFGYCIVRGEFRAAGLHKEMKWDLVFLGFFFAMLLARIKNSAIFGNESFLDMGVIASIMRNPVIPPLDPQFSGGYLDIYYYFSHWIYATLGIITQVPPSVVYNLILPTTLGMAAVSCYAIGLVMLPRFHFLPLLLLVIPRPSFVLGFFSGGSHDFTTVLEKSVQVIPGTGNNYPWYDLLWGIPHPHINALAIQVFLLLLFLLLITKWVDLTIPGRRVVMILTGITAGVLIPVNSWDALVYYPILGGVVLVLLHRIISADAGHPRIVDLANHPDIRSIILMFVAALGVSVPYLLQIHSRVITGIGFVTQPTELVPYLSVHGLFLAVFYLYLLKDIRKKPVFLLVGLIPVLLGYWCVALLLVPLMYLLVRRNKVYSDYFAGYAIFILICIELLYLQESVDVLSRYNTVFKISLALWPVLWIALLGMISPYLSFPDRFSPYTAVKERNWSIFFCLLICLAFISAPVEPFFSVYSIDGREFLELTQPDDVQIINLLLADRNATGIVEAAGDYDYHARISSFTGIPTIIGWPSVQTQWGRDRGEITKRVTDVGSLYHDSARIPDLIKQYHSTHMVIGSLERMKYGITSMNQTGLIPQYQGDSAHLYRFSDYPDNNCGNCG